MLVVVAVEINTYFKIPGVGWPACWKPSQEWYNNIRVSAGDQASSSRLLLKIHISPVLSFVSCLSQIFIVLG